MIEEGVGGGEGGGLGSCMTEAKVLTKVLIIHAAPPFASFAVLSFAACACGAEPWRELQRAAPASSPWQPV